VPIRGGAEEVLAQMHEEGGSGAVFTDRNGEAIKPDRVTKRFKKMARKAGLDERIHFHSLRHTTGSWLAMRGVPMQHIQTILGHSDSTVTEKYSHLAPETLDRAIRSENSLFSASIVRSESRHTNGRRSACFTSKLSAAFRS